MTEKHSHDVNVMLFKCVSQLSKLLKEGAGGVLFKPKDVLHCADATMCLIYSDLIWNAEMSLTTITLWYNARLLCSCRKLSCFLRFKCKRWFSLWQCKLNRPHAAFVFPINFMSLILCAPKKRTVLFCTCICKTAICLYCYILAKCCLN